MHNRSIAPRLWGALALACATSAVTGPAGAQETPQVVVLPRTSVVPPTGLFPTCVADASSLPVLVNCPVVRFDGYTTWAMTRRDNADGLHLVTYDETGKLLRDLPSGGTRYVHKITLDPAAKTASFWAQGNSRADLRWSDFPRPVPEIVRIRVDARPKVIPAGATIACGITEASSLCPVIRYRGYTTWIYTSTVTAQDPSFVITSYDAQGQIVRSTLLPGDRYLEDVAPNPAARTFTLRGQYRAGVALRWDSLP